MLLIGQPWLDATDDEGHRRIHDPEDRHRREIETAINRRLRTFIALMEYAPMPDEDQLPRGSGGQEPDGLDKVPTLHAVHIDDNTFPYGIQELITSIERATKRAGGADGDREREEAAKRQREQRSASARTSASASRTSASARTSESAASGRSPRWRWERSRWPSPRFSSFPPAAVTTTPQQQ